MQYLTDDYSAAAASLVQALALYRELGDRLGEADALLGLGIAQLPAGDYAAADAYLVQALALYRELGDRLGEADARLGLGMTHLPAGDYAAADRYLAQALEQYRSLGHIRSPGQMAGDGGPARRRCRRRDPRPAVGESAADRGLGREVAAWRITRPTRG
jgi:tetratricopeptide (TPR) repeat protein